MKRRAAAGLARLVAERVMGMDAAPRVFISYSWESEAQLRWVEDFANQLREDGVNVWLDRWLIRPGAQLTKFMETAVRESDFVLAICTPAYKSSFDMRVGGVGYEGDILTSELLADRSEFKFIPVLREGEWKSAAPSWALGRAYIDLRGNPYSTSSYEILLKALFGRYSGAAPLISARAVGSARGGGADDCEADVALTSPITSKRIVAHFLDHYVLELSGYGRGNRWLDRKIAGEATLAFRLSLVAADEVLIPAVSYFQSPLCRRILDQHRPMFDLGVIKLIGDAHGWDEFQENRLREYFVGTRQHEIYSGMDPIGNRYPPLLGSYRNTTLALHGAWRRLVVPVGDQLLDPRRIVREQISFVGDVARAVSDLPEMLGPRAFVAENAYAYLFNGRNKILLGYLSAVICSLFFRVLTEDFQAGYVDDLVYARRTIPGNARFRMSYAKILRRLRLSPELFSDLCASRPLDLLALQSDTRVRQILQKDTVP